MVYGCVQQNAYMCKTDVIAQVVNALLTQLDKLKHRKNVLIMSTSNLVKAIGVYLFESSFQSLSFFR